MTPWRASFTRRWHANPDLCHTVDPVAAHSGRMGILALTLFGKDASRSLLAACLCHDLGESVTGDAPFTAKQDQDLREALNRMEAKALADMGLLFVLTTIDLRRLKYLDRLDAYLWAEHHVPHVLTGDGWPEQRAWLDKEWMELKP